MYIAFFHINESRSSKRRMRSICSFASVATFFRRNEISKRTYCTIAYLGECNETTG